MLLLRNCDWSRQFVDEVLSYRSKEVRSSTHLRTDGVTAAVS